MDSYVLFLDSGAHQGIPCHVQNEENKKKLTRTAICITLAFV